MQTVWVSGTFCLCLMRSRVALKTAALHRASQASMRNVAFQSLCVGCTVRECATLCSFPTIVPREPIFTLLRPRRFPSRKRNAVVIGKTKMRVWHSSRATDQQLFTVSLECFFYVFCSFSWTLVSSFAG
eukprot:m.193520 g.193520  ORF g.193520 m.193520 type:complete len:129 (+) comp53686_c5_seq17:478-864(+)